MPSFEHPTYLWFWLVPVILIVLFYFNLKWKRKVRALLGSPSLIKGLIKSYNARAFRLKFYLILCVIFLGVLAAANLRKPAQRDKEKSAGIDIIIALDVSRSMLSQDIKPTRLDRAKQLIGKLTEQLDNNRVGLVVFAGQAILQMPLTDDVGAIKMYLPNINTDMVPLQGTVIGKALLLANDALNGNDKNHKAVILITDGEDHDDATNEAINKLYASGVIVNTIGVGTPGGSPILDPATGENKKDQEGNTVISKLDEPILKEIASKTGGEFILLNNDQTAISSITDRIKKMEKKIIISDSVGSRNYFYYFPFMIAIMLLILIVEIFIPERKKLA